MGVCCIPAPLESKQSIKFGEEVKVIKRTTAVGAVQTLERVEGTEDDYFEWKNEDGTIVGDVSPARFLSTGELILDSMTSGDYGSYSDAYGKPIERESDGGEKTFVAAPVFNLVPPEP